MQSNLIEEGMKFMMLGMGTVFVFLGMLIGVMYIMSKVIHQYFPETVSSSQPIQTPVSQDKKKIVAAIFAAIMESKKASVGD